VTLSQPSAGSDGSGGAIAQAGQVNAAGLIPIAQSPSSATTGTGTGTPASSSGTLGSAIGGATSVSSNLGAASVPLTPAPLSAPSPLPTPQLGTMISVDPNTGAISGRPDVRVLPQSLPEPAALALFVVVFLTSVMKASGRRRSGRKAGRRGHRPAVDPSPDPRDQRAR
jgi:hypothetical protein